MITSGEGKYKVRLKKEQIGEDILFILGGGEKSHIGGVVICEPGKKAQAIRLEGHFDDIVLKPIAQTACKKYKTKVVAIGGVHVNNATKEEINLLVKNCKNLVKYI
jgi:hypothetical protein